MFEYTVMNVVQWHCTTQPEPRGVRTLAQLMHCA